MTLYIVTFGQLVQHITQRTHADITAV